MPATTVYPESLPDFMLGKTRTKANEYIVSRDDALIRSELVTRNDIQEFDVSVICVNGCTNQPLEFEQWIFEKPGREFTKTIVTEFGRQDYNVAITKMPIEPVQLSDSDYEYSFSIIIERLLTDKEGFDRTLIDRYDLESPYIDAAINIFWPEA